MANAKSPKITDAQADALMILLGRVLAHQRGIEAKSIRIKSA